MLDTLQSWYSSSGLFVTQYSQYIDFNVGFCNDRNLASGSWSSTGGHSYAASGRLSTNKSPSLGCSSNDIIAEPVGLITADEVALAGAVYNISNTSYYLYTGQYYWTISPFHTSTSDFVYVFRVRQDGMLSDWGITDAAGVRPVINLSSDVQITGSGTSTDPYTVVGA